MKHYRAILASAAVLAAACSQLWAGTPTYRFVNLGLSGIRTVSINNNNTVVISASAVPDDYGKLCYMYSDGKLTSVASPDRRNTYNPMKISNRDQILCSISKPSDPYHQLAIWRSGIVTPIESAGAHLNATTMDVSGRVLGSSYDAYGNITSFVWTEGSFSYLPKTNESGYGLSYSDISDNGVLVGSQGVGDNRYHAMKYENGVVKDLAVSAGAKIRSSANAVNNVGQVVGSARDGWGTVACLWNRNGSEVILDAFGWGNSYASDINDFGQVVGAAYGSDYKSDRPFLYTGGQIYDLNNLVDLPAGWVLNYTYGINNSGWIIGCGIYTTPYGAEQRPFLLIPTPEPSSLLALLSGVGVLGGAVLNRRRRHL